MYAITTTQGSSIVHFSHLQYVSNVACNFQHMCVYPMYPLQHAEWVVLSHCMQKGMFYLDVSPNPPYSLLYLDVSPNPPYSLFYLDVSPNPPYSLFYLDVSLTSTIFCFT